ncbi:hypothetical protein V496_10088 [Pseudogymnoascus sp. VKM F-4515 (FW-2607)]|nr:hypothetical protein V496_10088 [Pseudogymnoascus sp. VKM F-4515 (FW-2607)]
MGMRLITYAFTLLSARLFPGTGKYSITAASRPLPISPIASSNVSPVWRRRSPYGDALGANDIFGWAAEGERVVVVLALGTTASRCALRVRIHRTRRLLWQITHLVLVVPLVTGWTVLDSRSAWQKVRAHAALDVGVTASGVRVYTVLFAAALGNYGVADQALKGSGSGVADLALDTIAAS